MDELLERYGKLLARVDDWFSDCLSRFPDDIACGRGCSACCRGLFDITLLDALFLRRGFDKLPEEVRRDLLCRAEKRLSSIRGIWPEFAPPFVLNDHPEEERAAVMPEGDETPCLLLGADGLCLLYDCRPLTCRLHGLPLVDRSGEVMDDACCTLNVPVQNPVTLAGLRGDFTDIFRTETLLVAEFNGLLTGIPTTQLDTLIPAALLIDFVGHDWHHLLCDRPSPP
jgi:Fe-S-cluster containining protein